MPFPGGVGGFGGPPILHKNTPDRLDKSHSALAEARLKMKSFT